MPVAQNWQFIDPFGVDVSVSGRAPQAQYPDGYLQTVDGRRGGRGDIEAPPLNERTSYERGINKFTKLPPSRYYFPPDFNVMSRMNLPVRPGPTGLPSIARQGLAGTISDQIAVIAGQTPSWGGGLDAYTTRPPWSP